MIPKEIITNVLHETDIVELISEKVSLKKTGANFKGLCPFHSEKTPSFVVSPDKQIFHCFGCHAGGDAVGFMMKSEASSFLEAIETLAERAGIELPKRSHEEAQQISQNELYYKINSYAGWFYRDRFTNATNPKRYMMERGFSEKTIEDFEIGYAPEGFQNLLDFFQSKKIPVEKARDLGLIRKSQKNQKDYDFFRHRIMFPIRSRSGKVIGFGGRRCEDSSDEAKYVNSPESPVYHKGSELYGLYQAKKAILAERKTLIVEGYIDVMACHEMGLPIAVAPLGTSLTSAQIKVLKRFADDLIMMFDGDEAGQKAAKKACQTAFSAGIHPRVIVLETGADPGDILENTSDFSEFKKSVDEAPFAMDWIFHEVLGNLGQTPVEKAAQAKKIMAWIQLLPDKFERQAYLRKAEQILEFSLGSQGKKVVENTNYFARNATLEVGLTVEEIALLALWAEPQVLQKVEWQGASQYFVNPVVRHVVENLEELQKKQETFGKDLAISQLSEDGQRLMTKVLASSGDYENLALEDVFFKLKRNFQKQKLKQITSEIVQAERLGNKELQQSLLKEKNELLRKSQG